MGGSPIETNLSRSEHFQCVSRFLLDADSFRGIEQKLWGDTTTLTFLTNLLLFGTAASNLLGKILPSFKKS